MPPYFLGFKRGFTHHATDELVSLGRARDAGQAEVLGARQLELSLRSAPLCSALLASQGRGGGEEPHAVLELRRCQLPARGSMKHGTATLFLFSLASSSSMPCLAVAVHVHEIKECFRVLLGKLHLPKSGMRTRSYSDGSRLDLRLCCFLLLFPDALLIPFSHTVLPGGTLGWSLRDLELIEGPLETGSVPLSSWRGSRSVLPKSTKTIHLQ